MLISPCTETPGWVFCAGPTNRFWTGELIGSWPCLTQRFPWLSNLAGTSTNGSPSSATLRTESHEICWTWLLLWQTFAWWDLLFWIGTGGPLVSPVSSSVACATNWATDSRHEVRLAVVRQEVPGTRSIYQLPLIGERTIGRSLSLLPARPPHWATDSRGRVRLTEIPHRVPLCIIFILERAKEFTGLNTVSSLTVDPRTVIPEVPITQSVHYLSPFPLILFLIFVILK